MLGQAVLNSTQLGTLCGNLGDSCLDLLNSIKCVAVIGTVKPQTIDTKSLRAHDVNVQDNLVVAGCVSTYMQLNLQSTGNVAGIETSLAFSVVTLPTASYTTGALARAETVPVESDFPT